MGSRLVSAWWEGHDPLLLLEGRAGVPEQRTKRGKLVQAPLPPYVRLSGPLGGVRAVTDAHVLRREAARLVAAADALDAEKAAL